jgi:hypothetical protein
MADILACNKVPRKLSWYACVSGSFFKGSRIITLFDTLLKHNNRVYSFILRCKKNNNAILFIGETSSRILYYNLPANTKLCPSNFRGFFIYYVALKSNQVIYISWSNSSSTRLWLLPPMPQCYPSGKVGPFPLALRTSLRWIVPRLSSASLGTILALLYIGFEHWASLRATSFVLL